MISPSMNPVFNTVAEKISKQSKSAGKIGDGASQKVKKVSTQIEIYSKALVNEIADPNKRSITVIREKCNQLKKCKEMLSPLKSSVGDRFHAENLGHVIDSSLATVDVARNLLEFDEKFMKLSEELDQALGKVNDQTSWLRLGEGESSFSCTNYVDTLRAFEKMYQLYSELSKSDKGYPAKYHEYLDGKMKGVFYHVESSLKEHSSFIHEKFPLILEMRREEVLRAYDKLVNDGPENAISNYREFSEAVQKLTLLQEQFKTSSEQLSKAASGFINKNQKDEQPSFFGAFFQNLAQTLFSPATVEEYSNSFADHLEKDLKFYSQAHEQLNETLSDLEKTIFEGQDYFFKNGLDPQSNASIESFLNSLSEELTDESLSFNEYVDIRRRYAPIALLFEQQLRSSDVKKTGSPGSANPLDAIKAAKNTFEKKLEAFEHKTGFRYSKEYETQVRFALLETQWKEQKQSEEWDDATKQKIVFLFRAIQLTHPLMKALKSGIEALPNLKEGHKIEVKTPTVEENKLESWTHDFLEGKNTTAIDYSEYSPSKVLSTLKQIEYNNVKTANIVPQQYVDRSYSLREECLLLSEGGISSCQAFTYSNDPQFCEEVNKVMKEKEWHPKRLSFQRQIISEKFDEALQLSRRINDTQPATYALRGNTASGKTRSLRVDPFFKRAVDIHGEVRGAINPDAIKSSLIQKNSQISHAQVHRESSVVTSHLVDDIMRQAPMSSVIIDKRLADKQDVYDVISSSEARGTKAHFLDIDVPLEWSCLRVLTRSPQGEDPLVPFDAVAKGYKGIRQNRLDLIEKVQNSERVGMYKLYSKGDLIAQKEEGKSLEVFPDQKESFNQLINQKPEAIDQEINEVANRQLTGAYLEELRVTMPYLKGIEKYEGMTIRDALNSAAKLGKKSL